MIGRLELFNNIGGAASSTLEGHVAMRLVHVINVVLVLHGLSIMLVLKYLC